MTSPNCFLKQLSCGYQPTLALRLRLTPVTRVNQLTLCWSLHLYTFDQISPGYFIDVLTEVQCSPDHIMPNWDEYDLVCGKKGKCYFTEPVTGHFPLLLDDELSDVFHHCLTTHPLSIKIDHAAHHINNQDIW